MIPNNLDECFIELDRFLSPNEKKNIIDSTEDYMINYHHNLGRHIRNEWYLWSLEPKGLAKYFNDIGIFHADDMSGIILDSYWRFKHNIPLDIETQVKLYQDYWAKQKQEEGVVQAIDTP